MGADKADKEKAKLEKKRLKAQIKAEKARLKAGLPPDAATGSSAESNAPDVGGPALPRDRTPWYRNPDWIRAIVAIASLAVMIITLLYTMRG